MSSAEEQEIALLRQRIVRLEAQVEHLFTHLGIAIADVGRPPDDPQIIEALKKNNIIEAIKIYREKTGLGLAESKFDVEEIKKRRGI